MGNKEYLNRAYFLDKLIKSKERERAELKELLTSIPSQDFSSPVVSSSGGKNNANFVEILDEISELDDKLNKEINNYLNVKKEIGELIDSVEDPNERLILRLRHIDFKSWAKIAEELGYSERQAFRIYRQALEKIKIN